MIKIQKLKKVRIAILINLIILLSVFYVSNLNVNKINEYEENFQDYSSENNLKKAGSWNLTPFVIDDDGGGDYLWSQAALEDWCSGSGTWIDPYVIENTTINALGSGNCLAVKDSTVYFIIRDSKFYNSGSGGTDAGIQLTNVDNGKLINNNCSNNRHGIYLLSGSSNNTILQNILSNVSKDGLYLSYSNDNFIIGNQVNNNGRHGLMFSHSTNNRIIGNEANGNFNYGIHLDWCPNNSILSNNAVDNGDSGITLSGTNTNNNNITMNTLELNNIAGITIFSGNNNNFIYNNTFTNNILNAQDETTNNYWDYNSLGNYWSDYGGVDANDDGIGDTPYVSGNIIDNYPIWDDGFEGTPIYIDGQASGIGAHNWTWASSKIWCSGFGSLGNPYIIKDLTIDATGGEYGIKISNSDVYFTIDYCSISNSGSTSNVDSCVKLDNVTNGQISYNNLSNTGSGIYSILLINSHNNLIDHNNVSNNGKHGIYCRYSDLNIISNNTVHDNSNGIYTLDSNINFISENKLFNNSIDGIRLRESSNNIVYGNDISNNSRDGIYLYLSSNNNTVYGNEIYNNSRYGLSLVRSCNNNSIYENTMKYNGDSGIILAGTTPNDDNDFINNTIKFNNFYGINIILGDNNIIKGNNFLNNQDYGVFLNISSHNNLVYWNYFYYNGQPLQAFDSGTSNNWDNGTIGNYWSDYGGVDANDNGIGDTPYTISGSTGSQDYLPIWNDGDDLPPTIKINLPLSDQLNGTIAPLYNVEIFDPNLDTMWYTIDGGVTNITFSANGTIDQNNWTAHDDGSVILTFYANDTLGHVNSAEVIINKDITPPTVDIITPTTNQQFGTISPEFIVEIGGNNLDTFWYSLDNGVNNFTFSTNETINQAAWDSMPNGTIIIRFYANDTINRITSTEVHVKKDSEDPIISIGSPTMNEVFETPPAYEITVLEANLDRIWYTYDEGTTKIFISSMIGLLNQMLWNQLPNGYVTIRFYANDTLGNISFDEVIVVKDTPAPSPQPGGIPGYNILLLLGTMSIIAIIIVKKKLNHLK